MEATGKQEVTLRNFSTDKNELKTLLGYKYGVRYKPIEGPAILIYTREGGEITAKGLLPQSLPSYMTT